MSPALRISLGLVGLTLSVLLLADGVIGIFPRTPDQALLQRVQLCEQLATEYSSLAERNDVDGMRRSMGRTAERSEELLSLGLRTIDDQLLASSPGHEDAWKGAEPETSTPTHVRVPIYEGGRRWGTLEVAFRALGTDSLLALLDDPLWRLVLVIATAGFAVYLLFMKRTLRYLDPNAVVPGRVRAALDQLVEGVFLLDEDTSIVLSNAAFADKLQRTPEQLTGTRARDLPWRFEADARFGAELPWEQVIADGRRRTGVRLELETPRLGTRILSANVAPILDGGGKLRGIMATFDDISDIEAMNAELQSTVQNLRIAQEEIGRQNKALEILATRDPLTGTLNRRAFFDKLDREFALAKSRGLALSCFMADIDHFKSINDNFGHAVGDEVIKAIAIELASQLDPNGAVGRYGGEEFCVVLPGLDAEQAVAIADAVRARFATLTGRDDSPTVGKKVTVSLGVASAEYGAETGAAMIEQADQALYHSKAHGRNRVTTWIELGETRIATG